MKRPTQVDVARRAGVSRATVSYVLNGVPNSRVPISSETRQSVLAAISELGYEPDARAQALRSGDTHTIGLIIPDMRNPHFIENADGVEQEARAAGYYLLLSSMDLSAEYGRDIFKEISSRRIDGLILIGSFIDQFEDAQKTLTRLIKQHLPIAEISDRPDIDHHIDSVICDYRAATQEVMAHLLSLNHRRIGLVYGVATQELGLDRLQPYQESLADAGLPADEELVVNCGPSIENGYQAGLQLLKLAPRPTAVIAINDLLATGVMRAAGDLGLRIPADLSVVGFDDVPESRYLVPRLTTVSKDAGRLGREAVKLVLERIKNPNRPYQRIFVTARLLIRESTAAAPMTETNP